MDDLSAPQVEIYTDGGADPNPGPGGWGAILISGVRTKEISGAQRATTNNRMELTAAISALRELQRPCTITLYTDSQYLRRGVTEWMPAWQRRGWRKANGQPVENDDLWRELAREVERHSIDWHWVKGHRGNPLNERADELATQARRDLLAGRIRETARPPEPEPARERRPERQAELPQVDIYTRGCALGVPTGPGGYAAILVDADDRTREVSGGWPVATSNVMELWAVIAGLRTLNRTSHVTVHTTSKYVLDGASKWLADWEERGWRTRSGKPVKNKEIWQELGHVMGDHDLAWRSLARRKRGEHSQRAAELARQEAERLSSADSVRS